MLAHLLFALYIILLITICYLIMRYSISFRIEENYIKIKLYNLLTIKSINVDKICFINIVGLNEINLLSGGTYFISNAFSKRIMIIETVDKSRIVLAFSGLNKLIEELHIMNNSIIWKSERETKIFTGFIGVYLIINLAIINFSIPMINNFFNNHDIVIFWFLYLCCSVLFYNKVKIFFELQR